MPTWAILLIAFPLACVVGGGILAAVAIPSFTRYTKRSKTTEAVSNLSRLTRGVMTYAEGARERGAAGDPAALLPPSLPRTPSQVPGATRALTPAAAWTGGWERLDFSIADPHYYSYEVENQGRAVVVRAIGDLDGDGTLSTFERTCALGATLEVTCGTLVITNELE